MTQINEHVVDQHSIDTIIIIAICVHVGKSTGSGRHCMAIGYWNVNLSPTFNIHVFIHVFIV